MAASLTNTDSSSATRGYDYEVRLIDGTVIHSSFSDDTGEINDFDLGDETAVTIKLTPKVGTYGRDFNFSVLNGNENNQFSFIYIGGNTSPNQTTAPPTGGECDPKTGICYDPLSSNIQTQSDGFDIQDASTCNDGNRPPNKLPHKEGNPDEVFNLNAILREARNFNNTRGFSSLSGAPHIPIRTVASIYHMYVKFNNNTAYNVKSADSSWVGNEEFGNFLYGAYMNQMGFSLNKSLRFSAGYQGVQDNDGGFSFDSITDGLYNFITNTGDGEQDVLDVKSGWKYGEEVFSENPLTSSFSSCVDSESIDSFNHSVGGTGGSPGSGSGGSSGGTIYYSQTCWDVCTGGGCVTYQCEVSVYWAVP